MRRLKTLFARLTLFFSLLLILLGAFTLWLTDHSTKNYFLEFTQRLNAPVAMYMADNANLLNAGKPDPGALAELSRHAMTINPSLEIYLLDTEGTVIAPLPEDTEKAEAVLLDLDPIIHFINGESKFPVYGEYPVDRSVKRAFSAHPLMHDNKLAGYVYVVFGGEKYSSLLERVTSSYVLRNVLITATGVLILTLFAGLMVFSLLTRRLRRLKSRVSSLHPQLGFVAPVDVYGRNKAADHDDEIGALAMAYDQLTAQLAEKYKALQRSDRGRRELFANISHDLRTPLTALSGYLETLQIKLGHSDRDLRSYADIAYRQTQKLRVLVTQLLELSIINSGEASIARERFSLIELVHDIAQDFQIELDNKQIRLDIHPDSQTSNQFNVWADVALIQRVFENLLSNAIDHTPMSGHIRIDLSIDSHGVSVCVADSGAGICEKQIADIFTRYHSGRDNSRSHLQHSAGTPHAGLGLAIVKGILELHGCVIEVSSKTNVGTRFFFCLPHPPLD